MEDDEPESDPADHPLESPSYAIFEGASGGGMLGAALGWVISRIAKRRRSAAED